MDGMGMPCSVVYGWKNLGVAVQCPNNECTNYTCVVDYACEYANTVGDAMYISGMNEYYDQVAAANALLNKVSQCEANIFSAANNTFGTDYSSSDLEADGVKPPIFQHSWGAPPDTGTVNLNITASTAGVSVGSYPVHWWTYIIGYGPTLHVVPGPGANGGLDSDQSLNFDSNSVTMHIDSGYIYNPIGLFFHGLLNFTPLGGYPGC
jgi:hypothetical protein